MWRANAALPTAPNPPRPSIQQPCRGLHSCHAPPCMLGRLERSARWSHCGAAVGPSIVCRGRAVAGVQVGRWGGGAADTSAGTARRREGPGGWCPRSLGGHKSGRRPRDAPVGPYGSDKCSHGYALSRRFSIPHEMWLAYPMLVGCAHTFAHKNRHKFPKVYLCEALVDVRRRMSLRVNACTHK